jgi:S1-C subfamily serine protease
MLANMGIALRMVDMLSPSVMYGGWEKNWQGVLVRKVEPTSPALNLIQAGDVLLRFDNIPVANEGTVPFRAGERISFGFLVSQKYCLSTLASILLV